MHLPTIVLINNLNKVDKNFSHMISVLVKRSLSDEKMPNKMERVIIDAVHLG